MKLTKTPLCRIIWCDDFMWIIIIWNKANFLSTLTLYVWIWRLMLIIINHDDKFQHAMWNFYNCYLGVKVPTIKDVNTMCEDNINNVCTLFYDIWIWVILNPLIFVNKKLCLVIICGFVAIVNQHPPMHEAWRLVCG